MKAPSLALFTVASVIASLGLASTGRAQPLTPSATNASSVPINANANMPDSELARGAARLVQDAEGDLLFQHSARVYSWAALAGRRKGLTFDPDLLFVAAMFHDYGLTGNYAQSHARFEVDGANAARDFLRRHGASESDAQNVWLSIALHTTNGISSHLFPMAALLAEGANMDLVGAGFDDFTVAQRDAVVAAHPRPGNFPEDFLQVLYDGLKHRPETTQGTGLADVMAYKDPGFRRRDFSALVRSSPWTAAR